MLLPKKCPVCKKKTLDYNKEYLTCQNCKAYTKPLRFYQKPIAWTRGKWWWWRVPLLVWFGWILYMTMHDYNFQAGFFANPLSAIDFGIHELGHMLFTPFGDFMRIAGGSLMQSLFPLMGVIGSLQKQWYFGATMCISWFGMNLFEVAIYAADARTRVLPLSVGPAGLSEQGNNEAYDQAHDWYQILSRLDYLQYDQIIAHWLRMGGIAFMALGIGLGLLLLVCMAANKYPQPNIK
jgi:hypothetical protein